MQLNLKKNMLTIKFNYIEILRVMMNFNTLQKKPIEHLILCLDLRHPACSIYSQWSCLNPADRLNIVDPLTRDTL